MRADRLISILLALQNGERLTVKQLAERLEVSTRTVTRDLEALSAAGVPVYAERGAGGGWRLGEGYRSRLNGMKRGDVERLLLASSFSKRWFAELGWEKESGETWEKLRALIGRERSEAQEVLQRIHIDGAGWRESMETMPWLPALYDALWDCRSLAIRYGQEEAERELLPLGLVAKSNTWYVVGKTDGNMRTYRVSRIRTLRETGGTFERPDGFDLEQYWKASMASFRERLPSYRVKLLACGEALERLRSMRYATVLEAKHVGQSRADTHGRPADRKIDTHATRGGQNGVPAPAAGDNRDGTPSVSGDVLYEAEVEMETLEYAVECLLRLGGEGVAVLEPAELVGKMRETVRKLAVSCGMMMPEP